ncbi:DUF116 domain-containing protein [Desulfovibrio mangrovi]|uniref:DUF116 domain-containing protein n=1 Tax=Desulfovibrio mangrovi TaxID=2976983 RepID=UPI002247476C|nr:DUF116 domain-containing protein [Desulfovibrio mangrovi]UZP66562.1 DUF116 domain-containing protein [Desulfovibrio mangrovi]
MTLHKNSSAATPQSSEHRAEDYYGSRKRLFIGLITGTSILLCTILLLFWIVPYIGLANIHPLLPYLSGAFLFGLIAVIAWASLGLVLHILKGRPVLGTQRMRGLTIKLFLPLMVLLARFLGISKERVRHSFIKVNNELVRSENDTFEPKQILILTPHCLQSSQCAIRLSYDVDHCKRCGKCPVSMLLRLRDHYGVQFAIATGGTIARRIVVQKRPRMIIAVACERDLTSGIQDTYPLPVYGVLNERPHGPCLDTVVTEETLEKALRMFLKNPPAPLALNVILDDRSGSKLSGQAEGISAPSGDNSSSRLSSEGEE